MSPLINPKTTDFSQKDWDLLEKYSPCLVFEEKEVLFPIHVGVSIIYQKTHPPCLIGYYERMPSRFQLYKVIENIFLVIFYGKPPYVYEWIRDRFQRIHMRIRDGLHTHRAAKILEYAVYYDADIQHVYDLEHVWVYLDAENNPIGVKATRHGMFVTQYASPSKIKYRGTHPILYVSPGKHAYYTSPSQLNRNILTFVNGNAGVGIGGVLSTIPMFPAEFWQEIQKVYPGKKKIVEVFRERYAHRPSFHYRKFRILNRNTMIPWDELNALIPARLLDFLKDL